MRQQALEPPPAIHAEAPYVADLREAKEAIEQGRGYLKRAAVLITAAAAKGATHRQIAAVLGKSAAWVNRLKKWHSGGYKTPGPFDEDRAAFSAAKQAKPKPKPAPSGSVTLAPPRPDDSDEEPELSGAALGAKTRAENKLTDAYRAKFPQWRGGFMSDAVYAAMARSLETGIEQPLLVAQREEIERNAAEYDAKIAAEHAIKFGPDLEKHYTARIKERGLMEGDCERPWQKYFDYRAAHPNDVEPLNETDLAYAGQWTSCAVAPSLAPVSEQTEPLTDIVRQRMSGEARLHVEVEIRAAFKTMTLFDCNGVVEFVLDKQRARVNRANKKESAT